MLVNPLVYDGYPSIGCATCTAAGGGRRRRRAAAAGPAPARPNAASTPERAPGRARAGPPRPAAAGRDRARQRATRRAAAADRPSWRGLVTARAGRRGLPGLRVAGGLPGPRAAVRGRRARGARRARGRERAARPPSWCCRCCSPRPTTATPTCPALLAGGPARLPGAAHPLRRSRSGPHPGAAARAGPAAGRGRRAGHAGRPGGTAVVLAAAGSSQPGGERRRGPAGRGLAGRPAAGAPWCPRTRPRPRPPRPRPWPGCAAAGAPRVVVATYLLAPGRVRRPGPRAVAGRRGRGRLGAARRRPGGGRRDASTGTGRRAGCAAPRRRSA